MDVFGLVVEGLNGAVQTLGRSETVTDQGTLGKQGPRVLEELDTLLHIFRCRVKNAVLYGFRNQNVPQGKLRPVGQGQPFQHNAFPALHADEQMARQILRHRESQVFTRGAVGKEHPLAGDPFLHNKRAGPLQSLALHADRIRAGF